MLRASTTMHDTSYLSIFEEPCIIITGSALYGKISSMLKSKKVHHFFPEQKEKILQFGTNNLDTSISELSYYKKNSDDPDYKKPIPI